MQRLWVWWWRSGSRLVEAAETILPAAGAALPRKETRTELIRTERLLPCSLRTGIPMSIKLPRTANSSTIWWRASIRSIITTRWTDIKWWMNSLRVTPWTLPLSMLPRIGKFPQTMKVGLGKLLFVTILNGMTGPLLRQRTLWKAFIAFSIPDWKTIVQTPYMPTAW